MKIVGQNIPAELYNAYIKTLGQAAVWKPGSDIRTLSKRDWYELIHRRSPPRGAPSKAQLKVRAAFLKCVDCFNASPKTGGVEPPAIGHRSKEWWYAKSLEPPEQNWKRTEMVTWAGYPADPYQLKDTNYDFHDANWFLKTDEQDFIDFYNEMKPKYGYPWSASNDPDQIITKMNQIVCDEIDYDHEGDMTVCTTPGQTAQARKGVCDDQSVLHYALTHKALKELEWTDEQINSRLTCVINEREDNRHMYNWWKSNAGGTKIIENTYNPGESPRVIGGMKYWGDDHPVYLIQRFDKGGHFEPVWTYPEITLPLWYYNYFIKYSWAIFYDDDVPDWCVERIPVYGIKDRYWKMPYRTNLISWEWAWTLTYSAFTTHEWIGPGIGWALWCLGWGHRNPYGRFSAKIYISKLTLIFKPCLHIPEAKWNSYGTIKIKVHRTSMGDEWLAGGAIRLNQTGQTIEQIEGWITFDIPKSITNYTSFDITLECLCRSVEDLRPNEPPENDTYRYCGSMDVIDDMGLLCS